MEVIGRLVNAGLLDRDGELKIRISHAGFKVALPRVHEIHWRIVSLLQRGYRLEAWDTARTWSEPVIAGMLSIVFGRRVNGPIELVGLPGQSGSFRVRRGMAEFDVASASDPWAGFIPWQRVPGLYAYGARRFPRAITVHAAEPVQVELQDCLFEVPKLQRLNLAGCVLRRCTFRFGSLAAANFFEARLENCRFERCDLRAASWHNAYLDQVQFSDGTSLNPNDLYAQAASTDRIVITDTPQDLWQPSRLVIARWPMGWGFTLDHEFLGTVSEARCAGLRLLALAPGVPMTILDLDLAQYPWIEDLSLGTLVPEKELPARLESVGLSRVADSGRLDALRDDDRFLFASIVRRLEFVQDPETVAWATKSLKVKARNAVFDEKALLRDYLESHIVDAPSPRLTVDDGLQTVVNKLITQYKRVIQGLPDPTLRDHVSQHFTMQTVCTYQPHLNVESTA